MFDVLDIDVMWNSHEGFLMCCCVGMKIKVYPIARQVAFQCSLKEAYALLNQARRDDERIRHYDNPLEVKDKTVLRFLHFTVVVNYIAVKKDWMKI